MIIIDSVLAPRLELARKRLGKIAGFWKTKIFLIKFIRNKWHVVGWKFVLTSAIFSQK